MSQKHEISCWKCHEMTSLETRNEFDGCCWACGEEIDLDDYLIKAMDKRDEHYAALSAVTSERDRLRKANASRSDKLNEAQSIIDQLRAEVEVLRLDAAIGSAIQRACRDLPEGFMVSVSLEKDAGTLELCLPDTDAVLDDFDGETFADQIHASIDAAMAAKEPEPEHVCSGCGAKGWTGNCLECIPY